MASKAKRAPANSPSPQAGSPRAGTPVQRAQYTLCGLWGVGAVLGLGTLVAQTAMGTYGDDAKEAWTLIAPLYVSVLSLLLGAIASGAAMADQEVLSRRVQTGYFRACLVVSAFANLAYLTSLWTQPLMIGTGAANSHIAALKLSLLWLMVVQGLVSIAIGGLFGSVQAAKK